MLCIIIKGDAFACVDHFAGFKDAFTTKWVRNLPLDSIEFSVYLVLFFDSQTIKKVGYAFPIVCSLCKRVLHSKGVTAYYLPRYHFNRFTKLDVLRYASRYAGTLAPLNLRGTHHCTCSVITFSVSKIGRRRRSDFSIKFLLRIFVNPLCASALNRRLVLLSIKRISKLICLFRQGFLLCELLLVFFLTGGRQVCRLSMKVKN